MIFFISRKQYLTGEVLKCIFSRNPRNMNFAKVEKRGGGVSIIREGAFIRINTVHIDICE